MEMVKVEPTSWMGIFSEKEVVKVQPEVAGIKNLRCRDKRLFDSATSEVASIRSKIDKTNTTGTTVSLMMSDQLPS